MPESATRNESDHEPRLRLGSAEYIGELLFVLVPLVVIAVVAVSDAVGQPNSKALGWFMHTEEWTFGAAVLFGQALQKMFTYNARQDATARFTSFFYVGLLVFGLIPAVVVNALVLNSGGAPPNIFLAVAQLVLFALAAVIFVLVGSVTSTRVRKTKADEAKP